MTLSEVKKAVINVLTIVVTATPWILRAMDVAPFQGTAAATLVSTVLGFAAVLLHYFVPNTTTDPIKAQTQSVVLKDNVVGRRTTHPV